MRSLFQTRFMKEKLWVCAKKGVPNASIITTTDGQCWGRCVNARKWLLWRTNAAQHPWTIFPPQAVSEGPAHLWRLQPVPGGGTETALGYSRTGRLLAEGAASNPGGGSSGESVWPVIWRTVQVTHIKAFSHRLPIPLFSLTQRSNRSSSLLCSF